MTIKSSMELKHAEGVVQRRSKLAEGIGESVIKKDALFRHSEIVGAVREVRKHRANILSEIDNEGAGHALKANELLDVTLGWLDRSRVALVSWGCSEDDIRRMEEGVV